MKKNITFIADEKLIQKARAKALAEHQSLNLLFRQWLENYVKRTQKHINYAALMQTIRYAKAGRKFTRDEMNER